MEHFHEGIALLRHLSELTKALIEHLHLGNATFNAKPPFTK